MLDHSLRCEVRREPHRRERADRPSMWARFDPVGTQRPVGEGPETEDDRSGRNAGSVATQSQCAAQVDEAVHAVAVERGLVEGRASASAVAVDGGGSEERDMAVSARST